MSRTSFTLAIILISVVVIGTVDAQVTWVQYIAQGNAAFSRGEMETALNYFSYARLDAINTNSFAGQVAVVNAYLACSAEPASGSYSNQFGKNGYESYDTMVTTAMDKTRDPATLAAGTNELTALAGLPGPFAPVTPPAAPFAYQESFFASQQNANNALTDLGTPPSPSNCKSNWGRLWKTTWGDMTLAQTPDGQVSGNYAYQGGIIIGKVKGETTLEGRWAEPDEKTGGGNGPHDKGNFIFTMGDDCNSFAGLWNYDDDPTWRKDWKSPP